MSYVCDKKIIGLKTRATFKPIRSKIIANRDSHRHVFPRLASAICNSSFHWFTVLSTSFVIGWSVNCDCQLKAALLRLLSIVVVFFLHVPKNSGIFGQNVNGKTVLTRPTGK